MDKKDRLHKLRKIPFYISCLPPSKRLDNDYDRPTTVATPMQRLIAML
jgi:hypothetical protein